MDFRFRSTLRKIAAGEANEPAMVGNYPYRRSFPTTYDDHHLGYYNFTPNPYLRAIHKINMGWNNLLDTDVNPSAVGYGKVEGKPITRRQLLDMRNNQAIRNATDSGLYKNTPQYDSAVSYLKLRGEENEANFKRGDLYEKGPRIPSKVKLPDNIKDPKIRKRLESLGDVQVNNNIPGGGRGQGFGIG